MTAEATVGGRGEAETRNVWWTFLPPTGFAREGKPWACKPNGTVWRQHAAVELTGTYSQRVAEALMRELSGQIIPVG
jgi:hypothetical protein